MQVLEKYLLFRYLVKNPKKVLGNRISLFVLFSSSHSAVCNRIDKAEQSGCLRSPPFPPPSPSGAIRDRRRERRSHFTLPSSPEKSGPPLPSLPPSLPLRRQGVVFPSFLELRSELLSQDFSVLSHHFTDVDNIMKFIGAYNELS